MTIKEEISLYRSMIQFHERQCDDLIARYGHGVRPSWVSEDLALAGHQIRQYKQKLAEMEGQTDA